MQTMAINDPRSIERFSAKDLLTKMQQDGPPRHGTHGPAAKAAIERIMAAVSAERRGVLSLDGQDPVVEAAREIASRFLRDAETASKTNCSYDSKLNTFGQAWQGELERAGKYPKQIGNAAFKMRFDEIEQLVQHPMFYQDNKLEPGRVQHVLVSLAPRELFLRLQKIHTDPQLAELPFSQRFLLVANPEEADNRVAVARIISQQGCSSALLQGLITATEEQKEWFTAKQAGGLTGAPERLIRIAKYPPEQREQLCGFVTELLAKGITQRDAMELVVTPGYHPRIRNAALVASELGLTSHGVYLFASSVKGQQSPTFTAADIKTLRELPLDWSDGTILRMLVGDPGYKPLPHSGPFQTGSDLKVGLATTMEAEFRINRRDALAYEARRLIAHLTVDQIQTFYGVFFSSRECAGLQERLQNARIAEKNALTKSLNKIRLKIPQLESDPESDGLETFKNACVMLSDSLISLDETTRSAAQRLFCGWIVRHAEKDYPAYVKMDSEAVARLAEMTVQHYDPKALSLRNDASEQKSRPGLYQAFAGNIRFFYTYAIKNKLAGSPEGLRAFKIFTEKQVENRRSGHNFSQSDIWHELVKERPDLKVGVEAAQKAIAEVTELRQQHRKRPKSASSAV
jgi:hypothetical protein